MQTANLGSYTVRVSNSLGSTMSDPAELKLAVWTAIDGTYQSLLTHDNTGHPEDPAFPGRLTITVTSKGSLTGKLEYAGLTYALIGPFTPELNFDRIITRKNQGSLHLQLHLDANTATLSAQLSETLSAGQLDSACTMELHTVRSAKSPAAQTGRYTARLLPGQTIGSGPTVAGYANINIAATGAVTLAGKLPDGSTLSASALLHADGSVAWYDPLYKAVAPYAGYLGGNLQFAPAGGDHAVTGPLEWRKPAQTSGLFAAGFTQDLTAQGSLYTAPKAGQTILTLPAGNDTVSFTADAVTGFGAVHLLNTNAIKVDAPNADKLTFTLDKVNGLLHGAFLDPATHKTRHFDGVVLQAETEFCGFFTRDSDAGSWSLTPQK